MYMNGTHQDTHQDTSRYIKIHQDTYRIGNYTKSYRKQHVTLLILGVPNRNLGFLSTSYVRARRISFSTIVGRQVLSKSIEAEAMEAEAIEAEARKA